MCIGKNAKRLQICFGVPFFNVYDEKSNSCEVAVRGNINVIAKNYEKFLKKNGYSDTSLFTFEKELKSAIIPCVKQAVSTAPKRYRQQCNTLDRKTKQIAKDIKSDLSKKLKKRYKVKLLDIEITAIECI